MRHPDLIDHVAQMLTEHQLILPGARVVVGVSGGADSIVLLHLLHRLRSRWDLALHVAHLDHGLRPDAGQDAVFVERVATDWQIPCTIERCDVSARCQQAGWSLEDGARRIRYQMFLEVAKRHSATHIALAHTADDQAETVLMRLLRGTGLLGLGAIPMKRQMQGVWLVRPLLQAWRRDLLAYVEGEHLPYREDSTNNDTRFVRNRIRHELLPLLERDYNPNIKGTLTQLAEQSGCDYAYLQDSAARQWKRLTRSSEQQVSMTISSFLRQPKALQRQFVRRAVQHVRGDLMQFEFRHWRAAERLFLEQPVGTVLDLPGGVQLRRESDRVVCQRATSSAHVSTLLD